MVKKLVANAAVDVVGDAEACRKKFLACIKLAGNNPVKQQVCLTNYMACLVTTSAKLSAGIATTSDETAEKAAK